MGFDRYGFRGRHARVGAAVAALLAGAALAGSPALAADSAAQKADATAKQADAAQTQPQYGRRDGRRHGGRGMEHGGPGMMMHGMMLPGMMHPKMLERMADELALTPEQRQTIRGFFEAAKPGMQELGDRLRANARQLLETTPDDPKYASVVQQASQEAGALSAQMIQQASQVRVQVYGVLTPEQKQKLAAKQAEMQKRMEERRKARAERRNPSSGS